jgi:xanthine dehydrogenase accessory factor
VVGVYDLALSVLSCLGAGTRVDLAWLIDSHGVDYRARADAIVLTPGGGRIGSVLGGALDDQLAELASHSAAGRLVELPVSEFAAVLAGLTAPAPGASARCLLMPATELPEGLWLLLQLRAPLGLVTELDGDRTGATQVFTADSINQAGAEAAALFARGSSAVQVIDGAVVTVLWPVPRLVIVGGGPIAEALDAAARLLEWAPQHLNDPADVRRITGLGADDAVVVAAHDLDFAGAALAQALGGDTGYIGSLGSRAMQRARGEWLAERAIVAGDRIHGPAGLDIGARRPAEVAVAIIAEILAERPSRDIG